MNKEAISSVFSFEPSLEELRQDSYWDMSIKSDLLDSITDSVTYQEPQSTMPKKRSVQEIMRDAKHLKTQSRYDKAWDSFMAYHNHPDIKEVDEEKFIQYFDMLINEKKFVCSTLWSHFSMLNSESQSLCGPKLNDFHRLMGLIKAQERGYAPWLWVGLVYSDNL